LTVFHFIALNFTTANISHELVSVDVGFVSFIILEVCINPKEDMVSAEFRFEGGKTKTTAKEGVVKSGIAWSGFWKGVLEHVGEKIEGLCPHFLSSPTLS
jgi:hypothetical protein